MKRTTSTTIDLLGQADARAAQYALDVLEGRKVVGEKIRLAVQRCLKDGERALQGGRWAFDPEQGGRPIRFMEKFMIPQGNYDRLELMPWQCFFETNLFGWVDRESGERKYRQGTLLVGGGNGKSPMIAGTAIYCISQLGIKDCNIHVFANSRDQAGIILDDCEAMITSSQALSRRFKCQVKGIFFDQGGYIKGHASDARKLDGIRPTVALLDEKHEMRNYRVINHCVRSLNKAGADQLMLTISTMGYVLDGPLVDDYRRGEQILKGIYPESIAERELVMIYELDQDDDYEDSNTWEKANPSMGVLLRKEDLELTWESSRLIPGLKADFLTKQLNLFTQTDEASFVDFSLLEKNRDEVDLESIRGSVAYGGLDMSASEDHCSAGLVIPLADGRLCQLMHTWVPEHKVQMDENRLPYREYEKMGLLTIVPGRYVQQHCLIDWFDKMAGMFQIAAIGYDPANATLLIRALQTWRGAGTTAFECDPVRQGALTLNAPMKHLRERFIDGGIVHNRNRLLEWYLNNVRLRRDYRDRQNENWVPVKPNSGDKIDGFMALLDAHTVYMRRCLPCEGVEPEEEKVEFYQLSF